jgi:hypothetical protein
VRAYKNNQNEKFFSKFSNIVTATTGSALAAPTNLTAAWGIRGQNAMSWTDNSVSESGYYVERSATKTGAFTQIANLSANTTFYSNGGLGDNQIYWYRVRAYSGSVTSAYSNTLGDTTYTNFAIGKSAKASTTLSGFPVSNGNDNNAGTRWSANGGSGQWWRVDLGGEKALGSTQVMWEKYGSGNVYKYTIDVSTDDINYFTIADYSGNSSTAQTQDQVFTRAPVNERYVRISITGVPSGAKASFFEFRVLGKLLK